MSDFEVPEDLDLEDVSRPEIDGWWEAKEKRSFYGTMAGSFNYVSRRGQTIHVGLVRLLKPCLANVEDGQVTLEPGQVLGVTLTYQLRDLLSYVETKGKVFATCTGKKDLGGDSSMNTYEVKGEKGKRRTPREQFRATTPATTDDVAPF
jgi:hypothetical protein